MRLRFLLVLSLLSLVVDIGCGPRDSPLVSRQNKVNVLLVTLDTVRADHFTCYGYSRATTPNFDALAEEGTLFEQAISTSAITRVGYRRLSQRVYGVGALRATPLF